MKTMIELSNVHVYRRTGNIIGKMEHVLNNVCFSIPKGSITAYMGLNGAGKTTTFRAIMGLVNPHSGDIMFQGDKITTRHRIRPSDIGFVPESPYFYPGITVLSLLNGFACMSGMGKTDASKAIEYWSDVFAFRSVLHKRVGVCSKGQVQRMAITQAFMHNPGFVLLDEPMSGLDPVGREMVISEISKQKEAGTTILLSSHIIDDIERMCDRAVFIHEGHIIKEDEIYNIVDSEYVWRIEYENTGNQRIVLHTDSAVKDDLIMDIVQKNGKIIHVSKESQGLRNTFIQTVDGEHP